MLQTHRRVSTFLFQVVIEMGRASCFSAAGNAFDVVFKKERERGKKNRERERQGCQNEILISQMNLTAK